MNETPLHRLWGKAKEHSDYDKEEWKALQQAFEKLEAKLDAIRERAKDVIEWVVQHEGEPDRVLGTLHLKELRALLREIQTQPSEEKPQ